MFSSSKKINIDTYYHNYSTTLKASWTRQITQCEVPYHIRCKTWTCLISILKIQKVSQNFSNFGRLFKTYLKIFRIFKMELLLL